MTTYSEKDYEVCTKLLSLKVKTLSGIHWTQAEAAMMSESLEGTDVVAGVAACVALHARLKPTWDKSMAIFCRAIEREDLPFIWEMSICETLLYLEPAQMTPFSDHLLVFMQKLFKSRSISLNNPFNIVGRLARNEGGRWLKLLQSLEHDSDPEVRKIASEVLQSIDGSN